MNNREIHPKTRSQILQANQKQQFLQNTEFCPRVLRPFYIPLLLETKIDPRGPKFFAHLDLIYIRELFDDYLLTFGSQW